MSPEPQHMIEVRGELIPHPGPPDGHNAAWERRPHDWMVKLTLARRETDPKTKKQSWREIDHTVVNHHAGVDLGGQTLLDLQRRLFSAIGQPTAVRTIVQRAGDALTLDWQDHPDGAQHPITDDAAMTAAGALLEEARLTLAKCGLIGG